jgi:transcriptional regulator with XRE-family HTH domain
MPVSLSDMMADLPAARRNAVERRTKDLVAEHRSLGQIRKALKLTQADVAKALDRSQAHVAQVERKGDAMVSTIARVVKAMGGELDLVVRLPHHEPVVLALGTSAEAPIVRPKRSARRKAPGGAAPGPAPRARKASPA